MTETYRCPVCNWVMPNCRCRQELNTLRDEYLTLRKACASLEQYLDPMADTGDVVMEPDELKELDKAVTVMKVGMKMVKRVLRKRGHKDLQFKEAA